MSKDREQVDSERERRGARGRRQSKETTNAQTCGGVCVSDLCQTHAATPWATMWCVHEVKVSRKSLVWSVSVYTTRRLQWIAIDCKRNQTVTKKRFEQWEIVLSSLPVPFRLVPPDSWCTRYFIKTTASKIRSKFHGPIFTFVVQSKIPLSLVSFLFLCREMICMVSFCKFVHLFALFILSIRLRVVIHDKLDLWEIDSEYLQKCSPWESTFLQHLFHAFQATRYSFCSSVLPCRAPWQRPFLIT